MQSTPGLSKDKKKKLGTLLNSGFDNMGIDPNIPFSELSKAEFVEKFSPQASPDKVNRLTSLQILNEMSTTFKRRGVEPKNQFGEPLYQDLEEVAKQDVKVGKFQQRGERPMRGLIPQSEMKEIYDTNLEKIDPKVADALNFSRITGVRISQIASGTPSKPNENQITKKMVSITTNEAGEPTRVKIAGITGTKKNRPDIDVSADSTLGKLIIRSFERPGDYLFNIKQNAFNDAFRKHISPTLLAEHEQKLPVDDTGRPMSSPMVARAAFSKQLADEFRIGDLETEFMMGQKPQSVLRANYAGRPDLATEDFYGLTSGDKVFDVDPETGDKSQTARSKSPDELEAESGANIARQRLRQTQFEQEDLEARQERVRYLSSAEGQKFLKKEHDLELQQLAFDEEKEKAKISKQDQQKELRKNIKVETAAAEKQARSDTLDRVLAAFKTAYDKTPPPVKKAIPFVGTAAGVSASIEKGEAADRAFKEGRPVLGAVRTLQAIEEGGRAALGPLDPPLPTTGDVEDIVRLMGKAKPTPEQLSGPLGLAPGELSRQVEEITRPERGTRVTSAQMDELMSK